MKRGTDLKLKFAELGAFLGLKPWETKGLLQQLWDFTAENCQRGDIGRFTDEQIAIGLGWDRTTGSDLVAALVAKKWLDESPKYRVIVHDWAEHCEEWVRKRVLRSGEGFATNKPTRITREKQKRKTEDVGRQRQTTADNGSLPDPDPGPEPLRKEEEKIGAPEISIGPAAPEPEPDRADVSLPDPEPLPIARLVFVSGRAADKSAPWLDEPAAIWRDRYGGECDRHELMRQLSGPREVIGHAELMVRWRNYVADTDARYQPSVEKFSRVHGDYTTAKHKQRMEAQRGRTGNDGDGDRGGDRPGGGKRAPASSTQGGDKYASSHALNERRRNGNRSRDPSGFISSPERATGT